MTPSRFPIDRNPLKSQAAFALQPSARMRFAVVVVGVLALPFAARAQVTTTGGGSCSGQMVGTVGLAIPQGDATFLSIPNTQISTGVFGAAECQCAPAPNNPDINLEIKLTTPFPPGQAATAEIWVGD